MPGVLGSGMLLVGAGIVVGLAGALGAAGLIEKLLFGVSGRDPVIENAPKRAGELQRSVLANGKAAEVLGWRPRRTLRDGLTETFAWFAGRAQGAPGAAPGGAR